MVGTKILLLLFIIFMKIGRTNGTGEENDNENDLFGEMWRKAFELNSQNFTKLNSDQKKEEKPKGIKIEEQNEDEKDDQKMGESENKLTGKIKMEPIFDQTEGKNSEEKNYQKIKKEPKIEAETLEDLTEKWHESERSDSLGVQSESDQSADHNNKSKSEKKKLEIVNAFEKMRKEYKLCNYKNENQYEIERNIARELGTYRKKIYKWRRELCKEEKKPKIGNSVKMSLIKKFDKMKKEYYMKNNYKKENRYKIEKEIARELGTYRRNINEWKRELNRQKEQKDEERKGEIIKKFNKMRNEYKLKNNYKRENRQKIECEIAKELGTNRDKIYKWKRELRQENEIDNKLGSIDTLSKWKYTKEQKREIVEHFDKLKKEFSSKFNVKMSNKIEEKIARKFGVCQKTIYRWRSI